MTNLHTLPLEPLEYSPEKEEPIYAVYVWVQTSNRLYVGHSWKRVLVDRHYTESRTPSHNERAPENKERLLSGMGKRCMQVTRVIVISSDGDFQNPCQTSISPENLTKARDFEKNLTGPEILD